MNEKLLWFNPNIQYMINANIVEYDMVAMSVSISEHYKLLDDETIQLLKLLPKDQRTRKVGLIQRDNKEYSEQLIHCELETRRKFLEANNLNEDNVLSLHSDACIFRSRKEIKNVIEGIEFKHANTWSSYMNYDGIEMFYKDGAIDYKGLSRDALNAHTLGIHLYLCKIFDMLENYDEDIIPYMRKFQKKYMMDKLPEYYYMPFGRAGEYKMSNLSLFGFIANVVMAETKRW